MARLTSPRNRTCRIDLISILSIVWRDVNVYSGTTMNCLNLEIQGLFLLDQEGGVLRNDERDEYGETWQKMGTCT